MFFYASKIYCDEFLDKIVSNNKLTSIYNGIDRFGKFSIIEYAWNSV